MLRTYATKCPKSDEVWKPVDNAQTEPGKSLLAKHQVRKIGEQFFQIQLKSMLCLGFGKIFGQCDWMGPNTF